MKAVGIKALKARLSEYIRMAKAGETVLVTDRDEVVAEIRPARRQPVAPGALDEELLRLADRGEVTLQSEDLKGFKGFPKWPGLRRISVQKILDDLREDRS